GRQRRARGPPARGVQPLPAGLLRVAQASRDVALLPQVRGAAAEHRRPRGRAAGDLAALGLAAAVRPAREPQGRRFVISPPPALVGAASAESFGSFPCEGRGGSGRGAFGISSNLGTPSRPPRAFAGGGAKARACG